jgi:hypothetical protein
VRERNVDLVARAPGLGHTPERLLELVLAELELQRPDDGHRYDGCARQHLLRVDERRQVDLRHVTVQTKRLLACADRLLVVLPWPTLHVHGAELMQVTQCY